MLSFVDQTDLASLEALASQLTGPFDLIIDDGLHCPNANIAVMTFALDRLKPGGFLVIEAIALEAKPIWRVVTAFLPATYRSQLVHVRGALCFVIEKIAGDA